MEAWIVTKQDSSVIATKPQTVATLNLTTEGLPLPAHPTAIQLSPADAATRKLTTTAEADNLPASNARPALNLI